MRLRHEANTVRSGSLYLSSLRRFWSYKAVQIWLFFSVFWYLAYLYCTAAFARDPTSYFFDEKQGYQRSYSIKREREAYAYIESVNNTETARQSESKNPSLCVGVATIARPHEQYVRGTIGSLLDGLTGTERAEIVLIIFIAHTDPSSHPIYHEPWLKAVSDEVLTYNVSSTDLNHLHIFEDDHHPRNKSMYDYGYLLSKCLATGSKWIAIIEDDNIARAGWYKQARMSVQQVESRVRRGSWLYLRMFYTEALLGWNGEEWPQYLGWSFLLFLCLLSMLAGLRIRSPFFRRHLSNLDIAVLCCCCLPASIALYFMAGRFSMQGPRPGVKLMSRFGCCSQGFIFPSDIVPNVIERTKRALQEDYYIDMLLERYADAENLARFATFPSLLQHIGIRSSKGWGYDQNAGMIWNFGFETFKP